MTRHDGNLPGLVIHYPTCGHCGEDVALEDGQAYCANCLVQWDEVNEDAPGHPDLDLGSDVVCGAPPAKLGEEYDWAGNHVVIAYEPCILPTGHGTSDHRWPYMYTATPLPTPTDGDQTDG